MHAWIDTCRKFPLQGGYTILQITVFLPWYSDDNRHCQTKKFKIHVENLINPFPS